MAVLTRNRFKLFVNDRQVMFHFLGNLTSYKCPKLFKKVSGVFKYLVNWDWKHSIWTSRLNSDSKNTCWNSKNLWQISFLKKYFLVCQPKNKKYLKITEVITYKDSSVTHNIVYPIRWGLAYFLNIVINKIKAPRLGKSYKREVQFLLLVQYQISCWATGQKHEEKRTGWLRGWPTKHAYISLFDQGSCSSLESLLWYPSHRRGCF